MRPALSRLDLARLGEAPSAETAAFLAKLRAQLAGLPSQMDIPIAETRRARAEGRGLFPSGGPLPEGMWLPAPVPAGRVRLLRPEGAVRGVVLHVHGGGWTFGAPEHYDRWTLAMARATGLAVVSVPYRLAPEHVWPACADDVTAAAEWLLASPPAPLDAGPLYLAGESAGAHLAMVTLQRLRDGGRLGRIAGAVLTYGCFDLRLSPSAARWGAEMLVLSTPVIDWFADNLTGGDRSLRATADVSPLLGDLAGLPPCLVQIGTLDPLLDDSLAMATGLAVAGVPVDLRIYPGGVHGFDRFDLPLAAEAAADVATFLRGLAAGADAAQ